MPSQQTLTYHVASTLDGFIARSDGSFDCFLNEGPHLADFITAMQGFGTVVMGKNTFEIGLKQGVTNPYPWLRTLVFSKSLRPELEPKVEITAADPVERVRELKREPGKGIWLCGGAQLARTLLDAGLVDSVVVKLNPVLLGSGISMLSGVTRDVPLVLRAHRVYENGVALLTYDVRT